jgi:hypothetical protein
MTHYDNFKSPVWQTRGHVWHDAHMKVWSTLRGLQPAAPRDAGQGRWPMSARGSAVGRVGLANMRRKGPSLVEDVRPL